jgi:signal transduction histidine kinase
MLDRLESGGARQRAFVATRPTSCAPRSPRRGPRWRSRSCTPTRRAPSSALSTALEETVRMGRLVDDLLLLARLDAAAPRRAAPVDLAEVVRQVAPAVAPHARLDVVPALVQGDGDALGRVVRNLVENAARHAASTVRVAVSAAEHVELVVDDDGTGIPEAERERVFDRFHRVDSPRSRDAGGAGLGLAIVRELVTSMGGTTVAQPSPLGGARLRVQLPRA